MVNKAIRHGQIEQFEKHCADIIESAITGKARTYGGEDPDPTKQEKMA